MIDYKDKTIKQIERQERKNIKEATEAIKTTELSLIEFSGYYQLILEIIINNDLDVYDWFKFMQTLRNAKVRITTSENEIIYNEILKLLDEASQVCARKILKHQKVDMLEYCEKSKKMLELVYEKNSGVISTEEFNRIFEQFKFSYIANIENVDYLGWASLILNLKIKSKTEEEFQIVNKAKKQLEQYIDKMRTIKK